MATNLDAVYEEIRPLLTASADGLIATDGPGAHYRLSSSRRSAYNNEPIFFGSVNIGKRYVSVHFFGVYLFPDLLDSIGDLRKRMQGKSCFNFTRIDAEQKDTLTSLIHASKARMASAGLLDGSLPDWEYTSDPLTPKDSGHAR